MILITATADAFGMLAGATAVIPILGVSLVIMSALLTFFVWLLIQFWLIMRGVPGWWFGAGSMGDFFTGGALPLQTPLLLLNLSLASLPLGESFKKFIKK